MSLTPLWRFPAAACPDLLPDAAPPPRRLRRQPPRCATAAVASTAPSSAWTCGRCRRCRWRWASLRILSGSSKTWWILQVNFLYLDYFYKQHIAQWLQLIKKIDPISSVEIWATDNEMKYNISNFFFSYLSF